MKPNITLTSQQKEMIRRIREHFRVSYLLTGYAGTGKSTTIFGLIEQLIAEKKKFIFCGITGTAAINGNGMTVFMALGLTPKDVEMGRYKGNLMKAFTEAEYVFIDEASMMKDNLFKAIKHNIIKGQKVIFIGDLSQIGATEDIRSYNDDNLLKSQLFNIVGEELEVLLLTQPQRQNDSAFLECLNRVSLSGYYEGLNDLFDKDYYLQDPDTIISGKSVKRDSKREIDMKKRIACILVKAAAEHRHVPYLAPYRAVCEDINSICVSMLHSESREYSVEVTGYKEEAFEKLTADERRQVQTELNKIWGQKRCEETKQKFYIGMKVMVTVNLENEEVLECANGSIATVTALGKDYVRIKLWSNGKEVDIKAVTEKEYVYYYGKKGGKKAFCYETVKRIPLVAGYAITAHKCQCYSLDEAFIDPRGAFAIGMIYTMLSRVRTRGGVHLVWPIVPENVKINPYAVDFYHHIEAQMEKGEESYGYTAKDLEILRSGIEACVLDGRFCTLEDKRYLMDKKNSLDKYEEYTRINHALRRNFSSLSAEKLIRPVEFSFDEVEDLEPLIDKMLEFNSITRKKDPRLQPAIIEGIKRHDEHIINRWLSGEFVTCQEHNVYGYPLLKNNMFIIYRAMKEFGVDMEDTKTVRMLTSYRYDEEPQMASEASHETHEPLELNNAPNPLRRSGAILRPICKS